MNPFQQIEQRLAPLKSDLLKHPLYGEVDNLESLQRFMEFHVYAVWDFMSLLKALQQRLACVSVPWLPSAAPEGCRLVNEIVLAEESDADGQGGFASHFELYHRSMVQCGAGTAVVEQFLNELRRGKPLASALTSASVPPAAARFVTHTFAIIESGDICQIAAAFTFGREDLLPDIFERIVKQLNRQAGGCLQSFQYYLERHIGLDSDEHSPMALRLLASLCGTDMRRWQLAEQTAVACLEARYELWQGIYEAMRADRLPATTAAR